MATDRVKFIADWILSIRTADEAIELLSERAYLEANKHPHCFNLLLLCWVDQKRLATLPDDKRRSSFQDSSTLNSGCDGSQTSLALLRAV